MNRRLLGIYLNDHLAGSVVGIELARRAAANNRDTPVGAALEDIARQIEEDRRSLREVMRRLGVRQNRPKQLIAWVGEKAGRLKRNGQMRGYSPLSRLVELEALTLGVTGKLALWLALRAAALEGELGVDVERLIERAESQRDELERHRLDAARAALG